MEIIIQNESSITPLDIITAEIAVSKIIKMLSNYKKVYSKEIHELKDSIHVTSD